MEDKYFAKIREKDNEIVRLENEKNKYKNNFDNMKEDYENKLQRVKKELHEAEMDLHKYKTSVSKNPGDMMALVKKLEDKNEKYQNLYQKNLERDKAEKELKTQIATLLFEAANIDKRMKEAADNAVKDHEVSSKE